MFGRNKLPKQTPQPAHKPEIDALTFEADISLRSHKSERRAWILAATFALIAILAVAAVVLMIPLKQTVPYYVYVNKETGVTQAVVVNDSVTITQNEAVARYWLARYVSTRERYVYRLQQEDFDAVIATSMPGVAKEYSLPYEGNNNRAELLKETIEERINILSVQVTPGTRGRGTVRFQKITWRAGMREPESVKTYVADIAYDFVSATGWGTKDLLLNPMGFVVLAYRATQELQVQ
jgi:type IV secretory pathway component VirB8